MSEFADAVREENKTELSRLGSSKALFALTEGEMEDDVVLSRAADLFEYSAERLDGWANDEAGAPDVAAEAATAVHDAYDAVAAEAGDHAPGDEPAVAASLADVEGTAGRLGALVGWTLVVGKTVDQLTGYFVGQADPQTAQTFRGLGDDLDEVRHVAAEGIEDSDRDAALDAANAVVQTAYDEYFETLEDLGVNPKPVC